MTKVNLVVPVELAETIRREARAEGVSVVEVLASWARVAQDARLLEASGAGETWEVEGPERGH
jgi:hypothetical protein